MVRTESPNQSAFTRPRRGLRSEDEAFYVGVSLSWLRLSEQQFRVVKWSFCQS